MGAAAIGAVTTASTVLGGAIVKGVSDLASYGDNIDKMSQKMGMSATAYQEWDAVMQHSGTSIESMQASMKTLATAAETGNKAFDTLGLSMDDIAGMSQEELFSATITALQNVEDETQRTYLAGKLLGRGATELGALLNTSAEDTQAMKDRVHELGGVMSDEAVKSAAAFQDSLQDMKTAFSGLGRGMLSDFLPSVTTVMDGLTELFSGNADGGLQMINQGVSGFVSSLSEALPQVLSVGSEIVTGLLGAITENLPQIVGAGADAIIQLVNGIVENLPQLAESAIEVVGALVDALTENGPQLLSTGSDLLTQMVDGIIEGIPDMIDRLPEVIDGILNFIDEKLPDILDKGGEILLKLALGIIQAIPKLVAKLPQIITSITKFLTDNGPKILQAGWDLLVELAKGIIKAIPDLVAELPKIVTSIVEYFGSVASEWLDIGRNILMGIWNGISDKVTWLKNQVSGVVDKIKGWFTGKDGFDEHSPSKWGAQVGKYLTEGIADGINSGVPALMEDVNGMVSGVKNGLDFGTARVGFESSALGVSSAGIVNSVSNQPTGYSGAMTVNLMFPDGTKLASYVFDPLTAFAKANGTPIVNPST